MIDKRRLDKTPQNFYYRKPIADLTLNKDERIGDTLFLIGTIIALIYTDQTEEALLEPPEQANNASPKRSQALRTLALSSWIFFMASVAFAFVALSRLREQSMDQATNQSMQNSTSNISGIFGLTLTAIGNLFKLIGFGLAAIGNQIRAVSVQ